MEGDGDMGAWLDELCRIAGEGRSSVMMLDCELPLDSISQTHDIAEVFSPPRVVRVARSRGLEAEWSIDKLTERAPGEPWNLLKKSHQQEVIKLMEEIKPGLLIGSPPCSWFSQLMNINWERIEPKRRRAMLREARAYLRFMCKLYKLQHKSGRLFLHEHPANAKSWAEEEVQEILKLNGVVRARLDMCAYNLRSTGAN